ncbi:MAG: DNA-binding protein [Oscillospiraceae bacterium]|nr:DNA-binding protein [Oscillospiraceae bacterium]
MKKPSLAEKDVLNPSEAAEFYDLSRRKFFRMLDETDGLPFVAMYKTRKLIIRSEFEAFLRFHPETKEALKNGRPPVPKKT